MDGSNGSFHLFGTQEWEGGQLVGSKAKMCLGAMKPVIVFEQGTGNTRALLWAVQHGQRPVRGQSRATRPVRRLTWDFGSVTVRGANMNHVVK